MMRRCVSRFTATAATGSAVGAAAGGNADGAFPPQMAAMVKDRFSLSGYQAEYVANADKLRKARKDLHLMRQAKAELDEQAQFAPDFFGKAMFGFLTAQQLTLFYWTYFRFDWNLVEPITYLLAYSVVWLSTLCWFSTGHEYTWDNCRKLIMERKQKALYTTAQLDLAKMAALEAEIEELVAKENQLRPVAIVPMD